MSFALAPQRVVRAAYGLVLALAAFAGLVVAAAPAKSAELTFNRAYQGTLSGQTFTTTTLLNADAGSIRFSDNSNQRTFNNTTGTLYYRIGGVPYAEPGTLRSRYPNGNVIVDAVAFEANSGAFRLIVLGGAYSTSTAYGGSSNGVVDRLNEYILATAPDPAQTTLQVNGGSSASVSVGGTASIVVTVKLASGAAVSGAEASISASPAGLSSISPTTALTNASGQASFTVQGLAAGTVTYNAVAAAAGTTTVSSGSVSITFVGVRDPSRSTASVPNGAAGAPTTVTITVRDGSGTPMTGQAGALSVSVGGANAGAAVSAITDDGNGTYSASYTPASVGLDTLAITLDGTPISDSPYASTVSAAPVVIAVSPAAGALGAAVQNAALAQTFTASGGTAPYSFAVTGGALPAGLTLASTGELSGTPTVNGSFNFSITATDANDATGSAAYSLSIGAPLAIASATLPTPILAVAYSQTLTTTGGTGPVTFAVTAGALPQGLSLDAGTGAISGTPASAGAYSFTVTATDANGVTATKTYTGTIGTGLAITTSTLPTPVLGVAYSQTVSTSGGTAPVALAVTGGALPAGLTLTSASGAITGTPTSAGAYSFTVTATDANGVTATETYAGTIGVGLAITTSTLPTPVLGMAYSQTVSTSGGTAPIALSVTGGALAAGLTLTSASGAITGKPTGAGAYSFTVTATDANGVVATQTYAGTIAAGVSITTATLPTPILGAAYSETVTAAGGAGSISLAVSAGALPAGLSFNGATGAITGTPTAAGAYSFTITATDTNGATAARTYAATIEAAAPPQTPAPPTAGAASADVPYESGGESIGLSSSDPAATFSLAAGPSHGAVSVSGATAVYVPAAGYIGPDSFSYVATTAAGASAPAVVSIRVLPPPPPTADSPPDQTLAGDTTGAGGDSGSSTSTTTVETATIALSSLIKGIATSVQIATPPKHGVVTLTSASSAKTGTAAIRSEDAQTGAPARAANPAFVAIYTPNRGFIGKDVFTFVAIGPGGTSAPATVNIEVLPRTPTARPIAVASTAAQPVRVPLTAEGGGPLNQAVLISTPGADIGATRLIEGGVAGDRTYVLEFRPNPAFEGMATITYTLANSAGVSEPLTVTITVTPRANPALDAEVRGLVSAETETARRFAGAQLDNFRDRLEAIRHAGGSTLGGLGVVTGLAAAEDPSDRRTPLSAGVNPRYDTPEPPVEAPRAAGGPSAAEPVNVWAGGVISVGRRDPQSGAAKLKITSSGISGGVDMRLSETLTLGLGGGFGHDDTRVGSEGSRLKADSWVAAGYASLRPMDGVFLDGVLGAGGLKFDIRRRVTATAGEATGNRDGDLVFGALTAGLDHRSGPIRWSSYGRVEGLRADLGAYDERGPELYSLAYAKRTVDSLLGVVGGTLEVDRRVRGAVFTPRARIELQYDFMRAEDQIVHYQDWLTGGGYAAPADGWARTRLTVGAGAGLRLDSGWNLTFDLGGEFGSGQHLGTVRVGGQTRF